MSGRAPTPGTISTPSLMCKPPHRLSKSNLLKRESDRHVYFNMSASGIFVDRVFAVREYLCTEVPNHVWRVVHSNTQSREEPATGDLVAQDSTRSILTQRDLKDAVQGHLN